MAMSWESADWNLDLEVRVRHVPGVKFEMAALSPQSCSDWLSAKILANVVIVSNLFCCQQICCP